MDLKTRSSETISRHYGGGQRNYINPPYSDSLSCNSSPAPMLLQTLGGIPTFVESEKLLDDVDDDCIDMKPQAHPTYGRVLEQGNPLSASQGHRFATTISTSQRKRLLDAPTANYNGFVDSMMSNFEFPRDDIKHHLNNEDLMASLSSRCSSSSSTSSLESSFQPSAKRLKSGLGGDDRDEGKKKKNREAAARCRLRKQERVRKLEENARIMQEEKKRLEQSFYRLKRERDEMRDALMHHLTHECPLRDTALHRH